MEPVRPEREGLPRGYRMRAEAHYVEHLGLQSGGQPVRMVEVDQIAASQPCAPADIRPLVESIRTHGVLHPLLIARRDIGYAVIAGHKRLSAARLLRMPTVPCFVHAVDEAQAALLARADNLHVVAPALPDPAVPMIAAVRQAIARHLAAVQASAALIQANPPHLARAAVDLVTAHSWRAARLVDALDALEKRPPSTTRLRPLASVLDRVVDGFAIEGRLSGADVRAKIDGAAAGVMVEDYAVSLIVSSGVLRTLQTVDHADIDRPAILVTASIGRTGWLRLVIAQAAAPAPAGLATAFFDEADGDRAGGWCAVACARAVKAATERLGGTAGFGVDSHGHGSLTVELPYF